MFLTPLDLILLLIIFIFVTYGFIMGLIEAIGSLFGIVLGIWIGGIFYQDIGDWLTPYLFGSKNFSYVVAFAIIYILVSKAVGILFWILNRIYKFLTFIPFLKTTNRFLGAILGLVEATLILGIILLFIYKFPFSSWLTGQLAKSQIAIWLMAIAKVLTPLLPKIF